MKIVFATSLFGPLITSFNEKRDILKIQRDIALIVGDQGGLEERIERILKLLTRADPSAVAYYSLGKHGRFSMAAEHAVFEKLSEEWRDPLRTSPLKRSTLIFSPVTGPPFSAFGTKRECKISPGQMRGERRIGTGRRFCL